MLYIKTYNNNKVNIMLGSADLGGWPWRIITLTHQVPWVPQPNLDSKRYQTHRAASTTFPEVTYQLGLSSTALAAREACRGYGGFLPYSYGGYEVGLGLEDSWHWVNYQRDSDCYASRPARWSEGVRRVDCQEQLSFACERDRLYQHPVPPLDGGFTEEGGHIEIDTTF